MKLIIERNFVLPHGRLSRLGDTADRWWFAFFEVTIDDLIVWDLGLLEDRVERSHVEGEVLRVTVALQLTRYCLPESELAVGMLVQLLLQRGAFVRFGVQVCTEEQVAALRLIQPDSERSAIVLR